MWPASMQTYWVKRKGLHKERVQLPQDGFGTPTWPPFHCFGTPMWRTWHHVKTLYCFFSCAKMSDVFKVCFKSNSKIVSYSPQVNKNKSWRYWGESKGFLACVQALFLGELPARSHARAARERTRECVRLRHSLARSLRAPSRAKGFPKSCPFNRVFSLTRPASMQIYWSKRKRLHKKRVQLPQDWFGTPTWPPFHCFGTPIWPPWRHVKTLYIP